MFENLRIFSVASDLANYAAMRQGVVAQNVANSDTPGYRAKDLHPFAEFVTADRPGAELRATRPGHLPPTNDHTTSGEIIESAQEVAPNGNSVSLETEMVKAADVRLQHDLALSVYSTSLNILKTSLGRGR